jgi:hypothetical protein
MSLILQPRLGSLEVYTAYSKWKYFNTRICSTCRKHLSEPVHRRTDNTMAKRKRTNNDLQNTTQKTKDRVSRTPLKPVLNSGAPERYAVPAPLVAPVVKIYNQRNPLNTKMITIFWPGTSTQIFHGWWIFCILYVTIFYA